MTQQKRARDPKAKEMRRDSILQAASELFADAPEQLPTISSIASRSGVAKGTVYLYFKSKEEIFLALLEDHYIAWLASIEKQLKTETQDASQLISCVCQYIIDNPEFLRLAVISNVIIEQNIERSVLMAYKNRLSGQFKKTASALSELSKQPSEVCIQLLMHSYALLIGLWQLANPSPKIAEALNNPSLQMFKPDFMNEAKVSLQRLWDGFLLHSEQQKKTGWRNIFT